MLVIAPDRRKNIHIINRVSDYRIYKANNLNILWYRTSCASLPTAEKLYSDTSHDNYMTTPSVEQKEVTVILERNQHVTSKRRWSFIIDLKYLNIPSLKNLPRASAVGTCHWVWTPKYSSIMTSGYSLVTFSNLPLQKYQRHLYFLVPSFASSVTSLLLQVPSCAPHITKKLWPPHRGIFLPIYCDKSFSSFTLLDSYKPWFKVWEFHFLQPKQKTSYVEILLLSVTSVMLLPQGGVN